VKPRLRHVAELAGVSQATVSRVLNGRPEVAETTRREVLLALQQLGYEPPGLGRARRRGLVGLIVPELDNPSFPRFAQAIESRLAAEGLTAVLCTSTPAGMGEADYLDVLLDHAVSGIMFVSGVHADAEADHHRYRELAARKLPVVLVNGRPPDLSSPAVTTDHVAAGRQGVAHLASLGHTRIGLALGPVRYVPSHELLEGHRQGCERAGIAVNEDLIAETLYGIEGGHAVGARLAEAGATGIICGSDLIAMGVLRALHESGRHVPGDVSVIGFDDAGPNAYVHPPLTSVQQPYEAISAAAVQLLTDRISDPDAPGTELRFRPELIVRASTGPAPVVEDAGDTGISDEGVAAPDPV
jgi:LacI family transcriptional regulator, repressor for deo operon, udp, cdd, tsx, nupC, and nupG